MMWIEEITEKELDFVFHENDEPAMVGSLKLEGYVTLIFVYVLFILWVLSYLCSSHSYYVVGKSV